MQRLMLDSVVVQSKIQSLPVRKSTRRKRHATDHFSMFWVNIMIEICIMCSRNS